MRNPNVDWRREGWFSREGWIQASHLVSLGTLVGASVTVVTDSGLSDSRRVFLGGVALLELGWYLWIVWRRYWEASAVEFAVAIGIAAALWLPLLAGHPAYQITIFAAYGVVVCSWLRRSIPAAVVLTGLVLMADVLDGGEPFTPADVAIVAGIGACVVLALAMQGAATAASERRRQLIVESEATWAEPARSERAAGASAEREWLAREIHDALAQGFTSIVMLLEAADARLPPGSAGVRAPLDQAMQTARDGLAGTRQIVSAQGVDPSEPEALVAYLERLVGRNAAAVGADVEVVVSGDPVRLEASRALALLRTAQEAVANARRHADASRIVVTVSWLGDEVILDVGDNGRGFEPGKALPGGPVCGFGLPNLARRAQEVGGRLSVDSAPGRGTIVSLELPLSEDEGAP